MKRITIFAALLVAFAGQRVSFAHEGEKHKELGAPAAAGYSATAGPPETQFELKLVDSSIKDALLGGESPPVQGEVRVTLRNAGWSTKVVKQEKAHAEKEDGVLGFHHVFAAPSNYELAFHVKPSDGKPFDLTYPIVVTGGPPAWKGWLLTIAKIVGLVLIGWVLGRLGGRRQRTVAATVAVLLITCLLLPARRTFAHEGEKHKELGASAGAPGAPGAEQLKVGIGTSTKTSATKKVGKYQGTLTAKTVAPTAVAAQPGVIAMDDATSKLLGIQIVTAEKAPLDVAITFTGKVRANADKVVKVGSFVSGRISQINVRIGDTVKAGQALAIIDSTDVAQAQAAWARASAEVERAKKNLDNVKNLISSGTVTLRPVDEVRKEHAQVASELASLEVEVDNERASAQSAVETAKATLARTEASVKLAQGELDRRKMLVASEVLIAKPLEEARNEMASARAEQTSAQSQRTLADRNLRRIEGLYPQLASKKELDAAQSAFNEAQAAVTKTESRVAIAQRVLGREEKVFGEGIYAQREIQQAETELLKAQRERDEVSAVLKQAQRRLELVNSPTKANQLEQMRQRQQTPASLLQREQKVAGQQLLATKELVTAQGEYQKALTDRRGAETALRLFQAAARQPSGPAVGVPVIAPISGIVVERPVNRGEMVSPSTTMFMLIDVGTVWLEGDIFEGEVARVKLGQPVRVVAAAFPTEYSPAPSLTWMRS